MPKQPYKTLHDYMERTGTNQERLLKLVEEQTGRRITPQLFSMILRGSRRCSKMNACVLAVVTGVPMDEIMRWPRYTDSTNTQAHA